MKKLGKKGLSLFLALLMCLTVFVLDWSGFFPLSPVAEGAAATPGKYTWKVEVVTDDWDNNIKSGTSTLTKKNKNGTGDSGSETNNNVGSYFLGSGTANAVNTLFSGTNVDYFPTKVTVSLTCKDKDGCSDTNMDAQATIKVYVSGALKKTYNGEKKSTKNGGSISWTCDLTDILPKANSISISPSATSVTLDSVDGGNKTVTFTGTVKDQYGVNWYETPSSWSISKNTSSYTQSINNTGAVASTTLTLGKTNAAKGNDTVQVKASYTGGNKPSATATVTVTPTYKISFNTRANGGSGNLTSKTQASTNATLSYTIPSDYKGTPQTGWTFNGWSTSSSATSGTAAGAAIDITSHDQTLYATYKKSATATYKYYNASGALQTTENGINAYNHNASTSASVPAAAKTVTVAGVKYSFKGWVTPAPDAELSTLPSTYAISATATTVDRNVNDGNVTYYAVYQQADAVTLKYDLDASDTDLYETATATGVLTEQEISGRVLVAGSYNTLSADPKATYKFTVNPNGYDMNRLGADSFLGWQTSKNSENETVGTYNGVTLNDGCKITVDTASGKTVTLYPVFKDKRFNVLFKDYNGELIAADKLEEGSAAAEQNIRYNRFSTAPRILKTASSDHADALNHYVWNGQYTDAAGNVWAVDDHRITEDTTVYAVYVAQAHRWKDIASFTDANGVTYTYKDATCFQQGTRPVECEVCGYQRVIITPSKDHDPVFIGYVEATCTKDGNYGEKVCKNCGNTLEYVDEEGRDLTNKVIKALGHRYVGKDGVAVDLTALDKDENGNYILKNDNGYIYAPIEAASASCTTGGKLEYVCAVCGNEWVVENTPAAGHDWETHAKVEPTCVLAGMEAYDLCKNCGAVSVSPIVIPALGHKMTHHARVEIADCTTDYGCKEYWSCETCGKNFADADGRQEITDLNSLRLQAELKEAHDMQDVSDDIPATCTEPGQAGGKKCANCQYTEGGAEIEALGHKVPETENPYTVVEPTCTEGGYTYYICSRCGEEITVEGSETEAKGHTWKEYPAKEATCTEYGTSAYAQCEVCDAYKDDVKPTVTKKLDHQLTKTEGKAATCTEAGAIPYYTCSVCHKYFKDAKGTVELENNTTAIAISKPVTCTENGEKVRRCTVCGTPDTPAEIEATGHTIVTVEAKEPTCVAAGNTAGEVCSVCGYIPEGSGYTVRPATGEHTKVEVSVIPATCKETGLKTEQCSVCEQYFYTELAQLTEHPADKIVPCREAVEPTCSAYGYTAGEECSVCGTVITEPELIQKKAHTEATRAAVEATCTTAGRTAEIYCSVCYKVLVPAQNVEATGHDWKWVEGSAVAAACEAPGTRQHKCARCDAVETVETAAALGHNIVIDPAVPATCKETGLTQGEHCTRCDYKVEQTVTSVLDHNYEETVTPPTCHAQGFTTHTCTLCGDTYVDTYTETLAHVWEEDASRYIAPTCMKEGSRGYVCTLCGDRRRESVSTVSHEFDYENGVVTPPTCAEPGYVTGTCIYGCGTTNQKYTAYPTGEHTYENGVCTVCGQADPDYNPGGSDTPDTPSTPATSEKCSKCGLNHNGRTGLWKENGFFCKIIAFFRNLFGMFR